MLPKIFSSVQVQFIRFIWFVSLYNLVLSLKVQSASVDEDFDKTIGSSSTLPFTRTHNNNHVQDKSSSSQSSSQSSRHLREAEKSSSSSAYNFEAAKKASLEAINLIHQRYEFHNPYQFQFYLASSNMPTYSWDILKYKIATKTLDGGSPSFLMIFGGSSVTAGHDNYYNESWPFVYERSLKPSFQSLGIDLLVHNIAHGANDCRPSNLCYEGMGGERPDWIGWEQSYNCGKDKGIFEIVARTAMFSRAMLYYAASGAFNPDDCEPSKDRVPYISPEWTPEAAGIKEKYQPTVENVTSFRNTTNLFCESGSSGNRFIAPLGPFYQATGHHGFSVWEKNWRLQNPFFNQSWTGSAYDLKGPCYDKGGMHYLTKEASIYTRDGHHGKTWHPSAGMHRLRGEFLAYGYLHVLLDAVYTMEEDLKKMSPQEASKLYHSRLDALQAAKVPEKPYYGGEAVTRPLCFTDYEPHYNNNSYLRDIIVGKHDGWTFQTAYNPDDKKYGYQDHKHFYEAVGPNWEIHFQISIPRDDSMVMVCGYSHKESLKHAVFYLDVNATDIGPSYLSKNATRINVTPNAKYHSSECFIVKSVPGGKHVLTVATDPAHPNHRSRLSHIVTFE